MPSPIRPGALCWAVSLMLLPLFVRAAAPKLPDHLDVAAIDAFLAATVRPPHHVGLSVAIVQEGRLVLARGYGERSRSDRRPVETNTLFAIGSVSKQFTCASILLLAEDGKLSVTDKVARWFPNLTRADDISVLDLMTHVSGYPDYYPLDFVDRRMTTPIGEDELLQQYAGGRLDFEPRTRWSYSNTGYILLGRIVEKVSGRPFGEFLTERILRPLGLDHTVYEPDASDPRLARGHSRFALGNPEAVTPEARGWVGAAGGIYSTPSDLAKWNLALIDGRVLKPASLALMTTPRQLDNGKWTDYGCGLSVRIQGGRQVLSHNGAVSGFNAWNAVIPSTRSCVIMMCNLDGGLGTLPGQVFALLQKEPSNVPAVRAAPATNVVRELFLQLQAGRVNRNRLGAEFDHFLTPEKVAAASQRLKPFGRPRAVELLGVSERGGMEVTTARLRFRSGSLRSLMYRQPDGTIEQFFVLPD